VQHLESLNDIVAKITDVQVRETVPDSVLEAADEVELIDLPPDDLIQRLKEGKVYVPDQAERAVRRFFRKGNLIALRELALRTTAARVDAQMDVYRRDHAIPTAWPVAERILVAVSRARSRRRSSAPRAGWRRDSRRVDRRIRRDAAHARLSRRTGPRGPDPSAGGAARGPTVTLTNPASPTRSSRTRAGRT
jgi:hypothetical protein